MKKVLAFAVIIAVFALFSPANAADPGVIEELIRNRAAD